ncbi:helix-turn-helix domain-containing protein [Gilvimarinus sp. 1_MG-2023]|uniref:helix-turn-helix domain-containing protein n=1 Tax=Gilvimarinus sp. 1_MG-2023 TaxID=3062638 RepID=UPI0026E3A299|nr:helix-turn-helix domain-containing protein [Gilvimarinus sp. 1_MG-2023]MDO6748531.1 helix-turn-helix domain-containing protein [Gilvimarinus sp. 1_MG-2023]
MISPKQPINLSVLPPVSSQEQFAQWLGTTQDTVRGWVENNTLPNVKIGRQRFINVTELVDNLRDGKTIFSRGDFSE